MSPTSWFFLLQHVTIGVFSLTSLAYLAVLVAGDFFGFTKMLNVSGMAVLKCTPIWILMFFSWQSSSSLAGSSGSRYTLLVILGLALSSMGDFALAMEGNGFTADLEFLLGLVFFLTAHVFYVFAFGFSRRGLHLERLIPFALFGAGIYYFSFLPVLRSKGLAVPVAVYITVIVTMVWRAAARLVYSQSSKPSDLDRIPLHCWLAFVGAMCFFLSDLLLAVNKFIVPFRAARFLIMVLYYGAQFGIAASVNQDEKKLNRKSQ